MVLTRGADRRTHSGFIGRDGTITPMAPLPHTLHFDTLTWTRSGLYATSSEVAASPYRYDAERKAWTKVRTGMAKYGGQKANLIVGLPNGGFMRIINTNGGSGQTKCVVWQGARGGSGRRASLDGESPDTVENDTAECLGEVPPPLASNITWAAAAALPNGEVILVNIVGDVEVYREGWGWRVGTTAPLNGVTPTKLTASGPNTLLLIYDRGRALIEYNVALDIWGEPIRLPAAYYKNFLCWGGSAAILTSLV